MVYERSKERGIRDEKQRHNDNEDKHNEVFEFSHHLAIRFSVNGMGVRPTHFTIITN